MLKLILAGILTISNPTLPTDHITAQMGGLGTSVVIKQKEPQKKEPVLDPLLYDPRNKLRHTRTRPGDQAVPTEPPGDRGEPNFFGTTTQEKIEIALSRGSMKPLFAGIYGLQQKMPNRIYMGR